MAGNIADSVNSDELTGDVFVPAKPVITTVTKQAEISPTEKYVKKTVLTALSQRKQIVVHKSSINHDVSNTPTHNSDNGGNDSEKTLPLIDADKDEIPAINSTDSNRTLKSKSSDSEKTLELFSNIHGYNDKILDNKKVLEGGKSEVEDKRVGFYWTDSDESLCLADAIGPADDVEITESSQVTT